MSPKSPNCEATRDTQYARNDNRTLQVSASLLSISRLSTRRGEGEVYSIGGMYVLDLMHGRGRMTIEGGEGGGG